eukprot:837001-Prymnesium_polylepis.1
MDECVGEAPRREKAAAAHVVRVVGHPPPRGRRREVGRRYRRGRPREVEVGVFALPVVDDRGRRQLRGHERTRRRAPGGGQRELEHLVASVALGLSTSALSELSNTNTSHVPP